MKSTTTATFMTSKLIQIASHDAENETELSLRQAFELLERKLRPPFSLTIPTPQEYTQLNLAILYGVLCEPHFAKVHMKHLHAIVTDGYCLYVSLIVKVVNELYPKLVKSVKDQLVWVTKEMVDVSAVGIDALLVSHLRQIVGGDFSEGNLWLCYELVSLFIAKWDWLVEEEPFVLASALFTYLRVLGDQSKLSSNARLEVLKRMEIDFCVKVLREQFHLCLKLGRDFIRLLQDLVHVPEFHTVWKDLLLNPGEFRTSGFSDISQIYRTRTSSRYLLLRITPEMETQLRFLLTHVKFGNQKRYQAWFVRKFLCRPERETLVCDIVRFICCCHHPSNEIIQSDVIPRWAVIGWLLKSCQKNYVEANVKLALFYDWLFFDESRDNIMNIEPAMLLMVHSVPRYIDLTHALLEFLFLLADNYDVERNQIITRGVFSAFTVLVRKGVVHSLDALTSCDALSPFLKEKLASFLKAGADYTMSPQRLPIMPCLKVKTPSLPGRLKESESSNERVDASILTSEELGASPSPLVVCRESRVHEIERLVGNLGAAVTKSHAMGLQTLERILFLLANLDSESVPDDFVEILSGKIAKEFELNGYELFTPLESLLPYPNSHAAIQSAAALVARILVVSQSERMLQMSFFWSRNGFPVGAHLLSYAVKLAYEAYMVCCSRNSVIENNSLKIGDSMMPLLKFHADGYFSYASGGRKVSSETIVSGSEVDSKLIDKLVDGGFTAYRCFLSYSRNFEHKEAGTPLAKLLLNDLMACWEWEQKRLKFLMCGVFSRLRDLSVCDEDIIRLFVARLDHYDLVHLQFEVSLKKFTIFGESNEAIVNLIKSSFNWGAVEQHKLWGMIRAELAVSKVQVEKLILEIFCSEVSDPNVSSIAIEGLLTLCRCRPPTPELVGAIILLPNNNFNGLAAAALASWLTSNASMLFDTLVDFLEKLDTKNGDSNLIHSSGIMINDSAIFWLLNYFDTQGINSIDVLSKLSINIPYRESQHI